VNIETRDPLLPAARRGNEDIALCGRVNACNAIEESRLARTVGTDKGGNLSGQDIDINTVQCPQTAEIHAELSCFKDGIHNLFSAKNTHGTDDKN
jgi:hypothetical protein